MWLYPAMFGITLLQGCALTICAMLLGRWLRILDFPDQERKRHSRVTPRTGGVAVCVALVLGVLEWGWISNSGYVSDVPQMNDNSFLIVSAVLLCGLGLYDDKYGMSAGAKFLCQALAVLPFVCWGQTATNAHLFGVQIDLTWLAVPVCLLWLVSCANFVNLVDGLDGLAGSVGLIVSMAIAALAWWNGLAEVCLLATILCGALVGFLCFNWPPARIFLGDSGSLPLGFLVGALSLEASAKKAAGLTLAIPVVLLSVPMFDTSMAILRRKLNGRRIGQGDREHIHHVLRDRGLSPAQTLLRICLMCSITAAAVLVSTVFNSDLIAISVCGALLTILIAGRVFGFNETMLLVHHIQAFGAFLKWMPETLRAKFVVVRLEGSVAAGELDLWHKIVKRAERLDALSIEFVCEDVSSGKELATLTWNSTDESTGESAAASIAKSSAKSPVWEFTYTVPRGAGIQTRICATGASRENSGFIWLNQLSELLVALCESWPVGETPISVDKQPPQYQLPRAA
ncbi:MAG TPA: MraY family glycosyltransferase [Planctomycetaceae bacterium]|jgi:UDP-GlcNAc:undecaprenyl-phosphate GlcNAc-1-phosphate transferase